MAVSKENKRIFITIPEDIYEKAKELAKQDNRSFSNFVVTLLKKEIENIKPEEK